MSTKRDAALATLLTGFAIGLVETMIEVAAAYYHEQDAVVAHKDDNGNDVLVYKKDSLTKARKARRNAAGKMCNGAGRALIAATVSYHITSSSGTSSGTSTPSSSPQA